MNDWYIKEEVAEEEQANIIASQVDYEAGDYLTLEEYEVSRGWVTGLLLQLT